MTASALILNGPNLNMLGMREPEIYGSETLADIEAVCQAHGGDLGLTVSCAQSNSEGTLVDLVQGAVGVMDAIVVNAGAYTHTSVALRDSLGLFDGLVIEVHISNIHAREAFRHHSFISARADGIIIGCGTHGYRLALNQIAHRIGTR